MDSVIIKNEVNMENHDGSFYEVYCKQELIEGDDNISLNCQQNAALKKNNDDDPGNMDLPVHQQNTIVEIVKSVSSSPTDTSGQTSTWSQNELKEESVADSEDVEDFPTFPEPKITIHVDDIPYQCDVAEKNCVHLNQTGECAICNGEKMVYECALCDKTFFRLVTLKYHLSNHMDIKPFECNICNKRFIQASKLKRHIKIHSGEKGYECLVCGKKFSQAGSLKRHSTIHTGLKPFKCENCDRKFFQRNDLKLHSLVHTGEKSNECPLCDKKFARPSCLKRHVVTHTNQTPFECPMCKKKFRTNRHLRRHCKNYGDNNIKKTSTKKKQLELEPEVVS